MYEYKRGDESIADYEAGLYGIQGNHQFTNLIVSDSLYSDMSESYFKVYSNIADSVEMYYKELREIAESAVSSGDFHTSLVEYLEVFAGLHEKIIQIGDSYKRLCSQFTADINAASEDLYESGCDPRDFTTDTINSYIYHITDVKGFFGDWLDNLINNIWEGAKFAFYNLTQKNKLNISFPEVTSLKQYRQALLDKANQEAKDLELIHEAVKKLDIDYETKFGELYDSLYQIKEIIDTANGIVERGVVGEDIASLRSKVEKIAIKDYEELEKETVTMDNVDEFCAKEENKDIFAEYSKELDTARGDLGLEEAIYAGLATGLYQTGLEVLGFTYPDEISRNDRYSYMLLKKELSETVSKMAGNPVDISEYEKEEIYNWVYKALNGDESKIPEQYKDFFNSILKTLKSESKVADYTLEIIEKAILPRLYDYEANLKVLRSLANTADSNSMLSIAVNDLINEYTNHEFAVFKNSLETFLDKILTTAIESLGEVLKEGFKQFAGATKLGVWCAEKAYEWSGIDEIGNASMKLYSLYEANEELVNAYKANFAVIASGNYTEADVENLNNSFSVLKSTYKEEFDLAAEIAAVEGNHDLKRHYKELSKKIDSMSMSDFL